MSKVYMIRHGQTLFNVLRRKQGWCDSPLTELGIEQARQAGAYFREQGIQFDHVYSSIGRCCDTTELIVPGVPYERASRGSRSGASASSRASPRTSTWSLPSVTLRAVRRRGRDGVSRQAGRTVTELMRRPEHESVLMVSHGAAIAQFPRAFGVDLREVTGKRVGNCGMAVYEFDGDSSFTLLDVVNPNE